MMSNSERTSELSGEVLSPRQLESHSFWVVEDDASLYESGYLGIYSGLIPT
jgi:hypothetical protein